mmetsp:Transcript_6859/g.7586  ORF Transcript_6859/g.7586 Transcript_6859/m.7586 type:complete len:97 (-) Transcript_6859:166-456(-)
MVFITATRSSTASRAVQRLISTSTAVARPVTSVTRHDAETRKIAFVGATILIAYAMKPSTVGISSDTRIQPKAQATALSVAPFKQFFGPDQHISSF